MRPRKIVRWSLGDPGDPYAIADAEVKAYRQALLTDGLPFAGGAVGVFGYDLVRTVEPLGDPNPDVVGLLDLALMLSDIPVIFDHLSPVTILVNAYPEDGAEESYADAMATIAKARAAARRAGAGLRGYGRSAGRSRRSSSSTCRGSSSNPWWRAHVEYAHAGHLPGRAVSALVADLAIDAFSVYRGCDGEPVSPYMYYLDFGDFQIAGASPEPLLTVAVRRAATSADRRHALARRDARGRPAHRRRAARRPEGAAPSTSCWSTSAATTSAGSASTAPSRSTAFMAVETYSHVMHIVSNVSGTLREDVGAMDAPRSILPGGTLSGAPKVRAMQIIDELEQVRRGGYGG